MAIGDAGKLGSAITKHQGNLDAALQEYQEERMAQTAKEVGVLDLSKTLVTFLIQGIAQQAWQFAFTHFAVVLAAVICICGIIKYCGSAVTHSLHRRAMSACTAHVHTLLQSLAISYCPGEFLKVCICLTS